MSISFSFYLPKNVNNMLNITKYAKKNYTTFKNVGPMTLNEYESTNLTYINKK